MADEDADALEALDEPCDARAGVAVDVVRGLVEHEHVRPLPERARDLQLLALAERELVVAPGHVVLDAERCAEGARVPSEVRSEVEQARGRVVRLLRAVRAREVRRHAARVRHDEAAGDLRERGLPAAVVAQKAGPALREGDAHAVEDGFER